MTAIYLLGAAIILLAVATIRQGLALRALRDEIAEALTVREPWR